ncbi:MAG: hypothetical protein JO314_03885 [Acidobacteria bacterium]|nr:hypothetical protein [Acidobacteriota bacterium]
MDAASTVALLLHSGTPSRDDSNLTAILDLFGIPWRALTASDARHGAVTSLTAGHSNFSILTSAPCLAEALQLCQAEELPAWLRDATSVYVYGFQGVDSCRALLRQITGDPEAKIRAVGTVPITVSFTGDFPDMCGPMSTLRFTLEPGAADAAFAMHHGSDLKSIVAAPEGQLFVESVYSGVRFFADSSLAMVDIRERAPTHFDVKKRFTGAVPVVLYLKWSFRDICWASPETAACLIIDDPLLKPRYGHLDFGDLLQLSDKRMFTTTIAFIPWNWQRTNPDTVATIQQNNERLSICVHGCDHTRGEFAVHSADLLDQKLKTARHRMQSLSKETGLDYDNVMVFPQGAFSTEAVSALKQNGFVAAVNTNVTPTDGTANETTLADLWSVAIMRYGTFPIFTRRYIDHGIENFAFDAILGKPCFIVGHHELFRDEASKFTEFLRQLTKLQLQLSWRTLGQAICRSYGVRRENETISVKMFAEQLCMENSGTMTQRVRFLKQEPQIALLKVITVNQDIVAYDYRDGYVRWVIDIPAGGTAKVRCEYHEQTDVLPSPGSFRYRLAVAVRRYLSELRDNYGYWALWGRGKI